MERNRPIEANSQSGDGRGRDLSGHARKQTNRGALTSWRRQREGLVRTRKQTYRPRRTHILETAKGGTCQDTETNRPTEAYSQPGDRIGKDKSGYGEKPTERGALTSWRPHRKGQVRIRRETNRARGTHSLETASGGTSQDTERNRPSEGHSHPGDRIGRDKSG